MKNFSELKLAAEVRLKLDNIMWILDLNIQECYYIIVYFHFIVLSMSIFQDAMFVKSTCSVPRWTRDEE